MSARYVVKLGDRYADGMRGWVNSQKGAFVFTAESEKSAKRWAQDHAASFFGDAARIVRLVNARYVLRCVEWVDQAPSDLYYLGPDGWCTHCVPDRKVFTSRSEALAAKKKKKKKVKHKLRLVRLVPKRKDGES